LSASAGPSTKIAMAAEPSLLDRFAQQGAGFMWFCRVLHIQSVPAARLQYAANLLRGLRLVFDPVQ
jgi:hypothetical protein